MFMKRIQSSVYGHRFRYDITKATLKRNKSVISKLTIINFLGSGRREGVFQKIVVGMLIHWVRKQLSPDFLHVFANLFYDALRRNDST